MYQIEQTGSGLTVFCDGSCVLQDVHPHLTRAAGGDVSLSLTEFQNNGDRATASYSDGADVSCILTFEIRNDQLSCSISCHITHERSYESDPFSANKGIGLTIGRIPKEKKYLSLYRRNLWWTGKNHSDCLTDIPDRTQSMIWKSSGSYYHLFPLADHGFLSVLQGSSQGLRVNVCGNTTGVLRMSSRVFLLTQNSDPYKLGERTAEGVDFWLPGKRRTCKERTYPEPFEYLGWCSWNAFYEKVSEKGVLEKAGEFHDQGVPVRWFLIDHGWSEERGKELYSFRENKEKFPSGLRGLKHILQNNGIRWMGVWQGMGGHWETIAKDSPIAREMKGDLLETNGGELIPYPDRKKAFAFWDKWHGYLEDQGVDFVKVDIQSSLSTFTRGILLPDQAAREAHRGLEASIGIHFNGVCINSMAMGTENLLNRPISGISRNSNDFFPHRLHSFTTHIYDNAYNALYHGAFVHGDWDMWWTEHEDARNNAYLRALSGGPIYISDCVGHTDPREIWPLIFSDGRILRCQHPGRVTEDEILEDPAEKDFAFKVFNTFGDTGYLGVFALAGHAQIQKAAISPRDIPDFGQLPLVLMRKSGEDYGYFLKGSTELSIEMKAGESTIYSFTKVQHDIAFVGLLDKYLSSAAISQTIESSRGMIYILHESGSAGYGCLKPHQAFVNGEEVKPRKKGDLWVLDIERGPKPVSVEIRLL